MTIKYRSTRGKQNGLRFEEVILGGLATDRGLYVPESIPTFTIDEIEKVIESSARRAWVFKIANLSFLSWLLQQMRGMTYIDLSYEVISKFVHPEDIPTDKLKDIIHRSFSTFRTPGTVRSFNHTSLMMYTVNNMSYTIVSPSSDIRGDSCR